MAFPMPEVPPTTTAHFPARLNIERRPSVPFFQFLQNHYEFYTNKITVSPDLVGLRGSPKEK
jgi:hypothetical protein